MVRDHRSDHEAPVVRDHRGNDGGGSYESTATEGGEPVSDPSGPSSPFANVRGPTWTLEVGALAHRFRGPSFSRRGSIETLEGNMASYGLESGAPSDGDTAGGAFDMRFTMPATEHSYAGVELGIGGLSRTPVQLMTDDYLHILSRAMIDTAALVGVRARHGIAEIGGELAGGVRVMSMTVSPIGAGEDDPSATEMSVTALVQARLRAALWVSPHVFMAAQAGVGVFDRSDVNIGLSIGLSSRPFARPR